VRYLPAAPLGRWQEEEWREETVIVKLTAVADLEILRVSGIYGLIEETRSLMRHSATLGRD